MENTINDERKELIKENLKIKNELQITISQYENIKRIHDNLLEEYLDLQLNNNFDKITIFQNEVKQLNLENSKLIEEMIALKEEFSNSEIIAKEEAEKIAELNKQKEELEIKNLESKEYSDELNLKLEEANNEKENYEKVITEVTLQKEEVLEENLKIKAQMEELTKEIENIRLELENKSTEKNNEINELNLKVEELNNQLITIEEEKKENVEKIEVERKENKEYIELLQMEIEEKNEEREKLHSKISSLEEKSGETQHYVEAMQQELAKAFDVARINTELLEEKGKKLDELEKNIELKSSEYEELQNELEHLREEFRVNEERNKEVENEEILQLKEELNEKEENLKTILLEKENIENDRNEKVDYLNELQNELEKLLEELKCSKERVKILEDEEIKGLNEENKKLKEDIVEKGNTISGIKLELENLKVEKNNFELNFIDSNDVKEAIVNENRELKSRVEEIQKEIENKNKEWEEKEFNNELCLEEKESKINELNICIEELNIELEAFKNKNLINNNNEELTGVKEQFDELCSKNLNLSEAYEELNKKFVRTIHKQYDFRLMTSNMLGKILEENNKLTAELKKVRANTKIDVKEQIRINDFHEEPRVDIKNLFGNNSENERNQECVISSFINGLEDRNELHSNEEKIGKIIWTEEILGMREKTEEIYSEDSAEEAKITKKGKNFVDYREFFTKEKVVEYLDFLKFMLPRAIEIDSPLLEKEVLHFSVSFAFYFYEGGDFWELLLNKLDIVEGEKEKYRHYLRREFALIFKEHDYCQIVDEKGERVGASIVMQSILPVNQMSDYLEAMQNIYKSELNGFLDKSEFKKVLDVKINEEKIDTIVKAAECFEKTDKMDWFIEYSYELIKEIDAINKGLINEESNLNEVVIKKIHSMI